jgi:hypothetical protein
MITHEDLFGLVPDSVVNEDIPNTELKRVLENHYTVEKDGNIYKVKETFHYKEPASGDGWMAQSTSPSLDIELLEDTYIDIEL